MLLENLLNQLDCNPGDPNYIRYAILFEDSLTPTMKRIYSDPAFSTQPMELLNFNNKNIEKFNKALEWLKNNSESRKLSYSRKEIRLIKEMSNFTTITKLDQGDKIIELYENKIDIITDKLMGLECFEEIYGSTELDVYTKIVLNIVENDKCLHKMAMKIEKEFGLDGWYPSILIVLEETY